MLDTIIIGSGPAGLTASIYASRYKLNNLVVGKLPGGTITYAHKVENFPGIPSISGVELGQKMLAQAKELGAEILTEEVREIKGSVKEDRENKGFKITTESGKEFQAKSLIAAMGTERRKLGVPGEKEYLGKGVSYCVTCDGPFFKEKTVVLAGGSNAACSGAIHLSEYAEKIYLIYRKNELRAEPVWIEEIKENPKIEVIYKTNILKILSAKDIKILSENKNTPSISISQYLNISEDKVEAVELDVPYKGSKILLTDGVFIEIGGVPASSFLVPLGVELDEDGYVKVDEEMKTNIAGLFAAGDLTDKNAALQQVITACAQGALAANSAFKYLKSKGL